MPWLELKLEPDRDWSVMALDDWVTAFQVFLSKRGMGMRPKTRILPGYQVVMIEGGETAGEIILSASERVIMLEDWSLRGPLALEMADLMIRVARQVGATALCLPPGSLEEEQYWLGLGAILHQDPVPLEEPVQREHVGVEQLAKLSLLVTYREKPVLCLEPIACNTHGPGPVSLAQRKLEKSFDGRPLGFASRVAVHCPWEIGKEQWDDLLAYSRLCSFDLLLELFARCEGAAGLSLS